MNTLFRLLSFLVLAHSGSANADGLISYVKVECGNRFGTGTVIEMGGKKWVLTADHVIDECTTQERAPSIQIFQEDENGVGIFHSQLNAQVRVRDAIRDFALLETSEPLIPPPAQFAGPDEINSLKQGQRLEIRGVNLDAPELMGLPSARLESTSDESPSILGMNHNIIFYGAEPGYSGGALIHNNKMLGLIVQYVLQVENGKAVPTRSGFALRADELNTLLRDQVTHYLSERSIHEVNWIYEGGWPEGVRFDRKENTVTYMGTTFGYSSRPSKENETRSASAFSYASMGEMRHELAPRLHSDLVVAVKKVTSDTDSNFKTLLAKDNELSDRSGQISPQIKNRYRAHFRPGSELVGALHQESPRNDMERYHYRDAPLSTHDVRSIRDLLQIILQIQAGNWKMTDIYWLKRVEPVDVMLSYLERELSAPPVRVDTLDDFISIPGLSWSKGFNTYDLSPQRDIAQVYAPFYSAISQAYEKLGTLLSLEDSRGNLWTNNCSLVISTAIFQYIYTTEYQYIGSAVKRVRVQSTRGTPDVEFNSSTGDLLVTYHYSYYNQGEREWMLLMDAQDEEKIGSKNFQGMCEQPAYKVILKALNKAKDVSQKRIEEKQNQALLQWKRRGTSNPTGLEEATLATLQSIKIETHYFSQDSVRHLEIGETSSPEEGTFVFHLLKYLNFQKEPDESEIDLRAQFQNVRDRIQKKLDQLGSGVTLKDKFDYYPNSMSIACALMALMEYETFIGQLDKKNAKRLGNINYGDFVTGNPFDHLQYRPKENQPSKLRTTFLYWSFVPKDHIFGIKSSDARMGISALVRVVNFDVGYGNRSSIEINDAPEAYPQYWTPSFEHEACIYPSAKRLRQILIPEWRR